MEAMMNESNTTRTVTSDSPVLRYLIKTLDIVWMHNYL